MMHRDHSKITISEKGRAAAFFQAIACRAKDERAMTDNGASYKSSSPS